MSATLTAEHALRRDDGPGLERRSLPTFGSTFRCSRPPCGVRGVLPHDVSAEQLQAALRAVVAGLVVTHPAEIGALVRTSGSATAVAPLAEPLTRQEREVLQMLAGGLANKEIAARLAISDHTAKFHVASILGKLGASTRTEAAAIGIRHGLVLL